MAEEYICKTAITTAFGLSDFTCMPFRLRNASHTFQRFIDVVVLGLPFVYAYVSDLLISSYKPEERLKHVRLPFEDLKGHGVIINVGK